MYKLILGIFFFSLCACGSGADKPSEKNVSAGAAISASQQAGNAAQAVVTAPTVAETEKAAKIMDFANNSIERLNQGRYSLADILHANANQYLKTFKLPARPAKTAQQSIMAPEGVFNEEEAALVAQARLGMDKALNNLLGHYARLEKYVADKSIQDDGKLGRELVGQINKAHGQFMAARRSWLEIVQDRAASAEAVLLHEHPLKRQIMDAQSLFSQFREVANILATDTPQSAMLSACRQNIANLLQDAAKPPFPASPGLERLYRQFLKSAGVYLQALDTGIGEGFYKRQKEELNAAVRECKNSYNTFAAAVNKTVN